MKLLSFFGFVAALVAVGVLLKTRNASPLVVDAASLHPGEFKKSENKEEVFKRALWRRPTTQDTIVQAEHREWNTAPGEGASHWQWFIEVEPSPSLVAWLKEQNPFSTRSVTQMTVEAAPDWFPKDMSSYEIKQGGSLGNLFFLHSRDGKHLFATGSGVGLQAGVKEPAKTVPASSTQLARRLPANPPPQTSR